MTECGRRSRPQGIQMWMFAQLLRRIMPPAFKGRSAMRLGASGALKGEKKTYQMDPANSDRRSVWSA